MHYTWHINKTAFHDSHFQPTLSHCFLHGFISCSVLSRYTLRSRQHSHLNTKLTIPIHKHIPEHFVHSSFFAYGFHLFTKRCCPLLLCQVDGRGMYILSCAACLIYDKTSHNGSFILSPVQYIFTIQVSRLVLISDRVVNWASVVRWSDI